MKMALATAGMLVLASFTPGHATQASPVAKVIEMISELQAKIIGEGKEAQSIYDEFAEWCEDQSKELKFEIKDGKVQVKDLTAIIEDETAKIEALDARIQKLSETIAENEAELKEATGIREKEHKDFVAEEKELTDVIDTLQRAIGILEKEMNKGGASMLQMQNAGSILQALEVLVRASVVNSADAAHLTALVQSSQRSADDDTNLGAPAGEVYKGQSGGIIDAISDLLEKAEAQVNELRTKEAKALNDYEMLAQSLNDEISFATKDMNNSKKNHAASSEKKAAAEGDLGVTTADLQEDTSALEKLHTECMTKASDFETETKSRGEELAALAKAKQIITEATSLAQVSLLQVRSTSSSGNEVVQFLHALAKKQHSAQLTQLASRLSSTFSLGSGDDVFAKVKSLITDMIAKLEKEAEADATKKAYCDKELGETNEKKDAKTTEIEKMTTKIDGDRAEAAELKEQVAELEKELSDLASSQAEMDKLRAKEHELYVAERAELEKGLNGIKLALKVLREYYNSAGKGAASGASTGIIGLLEVCESDFSKELSEVISVEDTAQNLYEAETKENEKEKATKEKDVEYKSKESVSLEKAAAEMKNDRSGVQAELDTVLKYLAEVEAECIEKAETYEEKAARRQAEIDGLKEALDILSNEAAFIQKASSRALRTVRAH